MCFFNCNIIFGDGFDMLCIDLGEFIVLLDSIVRDEGIQKFGVFFGLVRGSYGELDVFFMFRSCKDFFGYDFDLDSELFLDEQSSFYVFLYLLDSEDDGVGVEEKWDLVRGVVYSIFKGDVVVNYVLVGWFDQSLVESDSEDFSGKFCLKVEIKVSVELYCEEQGSYCGEYFLDQESGGVVRFVSSQFLEQRKGILKNKVIYLLLLMLMEQMLKGWFWEKLVDCEQSFIFLCMFFLGFGGFDCVIIVKSFGRELGCDYFNGVVMNVCIGSVQVDGFDFEKL